MQSRVKVGSPTPFPKDPPCSIFWGTKNLENFQYKPGKKIHLQKHDHRTCTVFFHKGVTA